MTMKNSISTFFFLVIFTSVTYGQNVGEDWGGWEVSNILGIEYRIKYEYFNKISANQGKPPHVWIMQVRNSFTTKKGVSWVVTDIGKDDTNPNLHRRNNCLKPGEIAFSPTHFTNTPQGGMISVRFFKLTDCNY